MMMMMMMLLLLLMMMNHMALSNYFKQFCASEVSQLNPIPLPPERMQTWGEQSASAGAVYVALCVRGTK